ncbi:hypothetical protein Ancab_035016 [Ancistrocladus abbreviatus]
MPVGCGSLLWDHLASNVNQYIQSPAPDEVSEAKPASLEHAVRSVSQCVESESERVKSDRMLTSQHNREWKGPGVPQPSLHNSETDIAQKEGNAQRNTGHTRQFVSPEPLGQKKEETSQRGTTNQGLIMLE